MDGKECGAKFAVAPHFDVLRDACHLSSILEVTQLANSDFRFPFPFSDSDADFECCARPFLDFFRDILCQKKRKKH